VRQRNEKIEEDTSSQNEATGIKKNYRIEEEEKEAQKKKKKKNDRDTGRNH